MPTASINREINRNLQVGAGLFYYMVLYTKYLHSVGRGESLRVQVIAHIYSGMASSSTTQQPRVSGPGVHNGLD